MPIQIIVLINLILSAWNNVIQTRHPHLHVIPAFTGMTNKYKGDE